MTMGPPHFLRLPNELLLKITHYIASVPHDKNRDLLSLATVCHRFRPVSQEVLLTRPVFNLFNIVRVVEAYLRNPGYSSKVYSLEITTANRDLRKREEVLDIYRPDCTRRTEPSSLKVPPQVDLSYLKLDQLFWVKCIGIIRKADTMTYDDHDQWVEHLTQPDTYLLAWLALLLMLVPNVQELLLGQNYLPYLSEIIYVFGHEWSIDPARDIDVPQYRLEAARRLQTQLQTLELPDFWYRDFPKGSNKYAPLPLLSCFSQLKTVTVPFRALILATNQDTGLRSMNGDYTTQHILPSSIEVLRIVDINATGVEKELPRFIDSTATVFTNLRRVELYHQCATDRLELIHGTSNYGMTAANLHIVLQQMMASRAAVLQSNINPAFFPLVSSVTNRASVKAAEYEEALEVITAQSQSLDIEMYVWFPVHELQAIDAYGHPWQYSAEERRKLEYSAAVQKENYLMHKRLEEYRHQKGTQELLEGAFDVAAREGEQSEGQGGVTAVAKRLSFRSS